MYYTERKPKNKKRGRPGNEARLYVVIIYIFHSVDEAEKNGETAMEVDKPAGDEQPTGESIF